MHQSSDDPDLEVNDPDLKGNDRRRAHHATLSNSRLKPPFLFMYCLYLRFFTTCTAPTLLPGTGLPLVDSKLENPNIFSIVSFSSFGTSSTDNEDSGCAGGGGVGGKGIESGSGIIC